MKGWSLSSGCGPLCGLIVMPGREIGRKRSAMRKIEPSAAGAFSIAVRSAISPPGTKAPTICQRWRRTMFSGAAERFVRIEPVSDFA